jgi:hypothetical protein
MINGAELSGIFRTVVELEFQSIVFKTEFFYLLQGVKS